ncbi:MAG TPA: HAD family phosphatase [Acidobacteriaceae bacterium]|nr:HAD family phosphatase [Acidobacteriaceae bacterium]
MSTNSPLRAVIFDYGEVLCQPDPAAHRHLLSLTGLDHATFERHYWRDRHNYDLGRHDGPSFWRQFAQDASLSFAPEQIDALIESDVTLWTRLLDPRMIAWIEALQKAGLRTAILSNMVTEVLGRMRRDFPWLHGFTHLTWSCELGIAKPDPAIYLHTCEKLGVHPDEALFIDDKLVNVHAAEQVGLHALHFRSVEQLRADLAAHDLLQGMPQPGEDPVTTPA